MIEVMDAKDQPLDFFYDVDGNRRGYGSRQRKILRDVHLKGFAIYDADNPIISKRHMRATVRGLREYGHKILYFAYKRRGIDICVVYMAEHAKDLLDELFKRYDFGRSWKEVRRMVLKGLDKKKAKADVFYRYGG